VGRNRNHVSCYIKYYERGGETFKTRYKNNHRGVGSDQKVRKNLGAEKEVKITSAGSQEKMSGGNRSKGGKGIALWNQVAKAGGEDWKGKMQGEDNGVDGKRRASIGGGELKGKEGRIHQRVGTKGYSCKGKLGMGRANRSQLFLQLQKK